MKSAPMPMETPDVAQLDQVMKDLTKEMPKVGRNEDMKDLLKLDDMETK